MKYLIIIHSPLQVINAYEFIKINNLSNNNYEILFLSTNDTQNDKTISSLIQDMLKPDYIFKQIFLKNLRSIKKLNEFISLIKNQNKNFEYVVFGNINSLTIRYIINRLDKKNILMDDGTSTLNFDYYKKNKYLIDEKTSIYLKIKYIILNKIFKLDYNLPKVEYFFTYFYKMNNYKIQKNSLKYFKKKYISKHFKKNNITYFLGQPLYNDGPISLDEYKKIIIKIKHHFTKEKLIYILHRHENKEIFKFLNNNNIQYISINEPFEIFLIKNKILPKNITSVSSTALVTCNLLFNNNESNIVKIQVAEHYYKGVEAYLFIDSKIKEYIDINNIIKL